jgi:hypothetical protein
MRLHSLCLLCVGATVLVAHGSSGQETVPNPGDLTRLNVTVQQVRYRDRAAVKLELTEPVQRELNAKTVLDNVVAMALLPGNFTNGTIQVDLAGEVNGKGRPDARAFVGIAFHVAPDNSRYEAVYLRMTNGRLAQPTPPAPRIDRAIQYIAHPDFHFQVSRDGFPGRYERGANVAPGTWVRFRLQVSGSQLRAFINDEAEPALAVDDLKLANTTGKVGLLIDDGTAGYFSNVTIRSM